MPYKDELDDLLPTMVNRRRLIGIKTTTETPFREWGIALLRKYTPDALNVQHFRYWSIINTEVFQTRTINCDTNGHFEGCVVEQGSLNHQDELLERQRHKSWLYISRDVVCNRGTPLRIQFNFVYIMTGDFYNLHEVPTGLIGDVDPSVYRRNINGN